MAGGRTIFTVISVFAVIGVFSAPAPANDSPAQAGAIETMSPEAIFGEPTPLPEGVEAPRPPLGGRQCGVVVYENAYNGSGFYLPTGAGGRVADDCALVGVQRGACEVYSNIYNPGPSTNTITLELWDDCPQGGGVLLATSSPFSLPGYAISTVTWNISPNVPVGNSLWVAWTSPQADVGPLISETAEIGYTADRFGTDSCGGGGPTCYCWYNGNPYAGLDVTISAVEIPYACCLPDDTCMDLYMADCTTAGGTPYVGAYCDTFICPPECPSDTIYGQNVVVPTDGWTAYTSDADIGWLVYDNFSGLTESICDLHFWGFQGYYDSGWTSCYEDPMTFEIKFYQDAGGMPGAEACSYTVMLNGADTGITYPGSINWTLYEYSTSLSPCCALTDGWISIQAIGGPTCSFLWPNGYGPGDGSFQWDGASLNPKTSDLAFCLTASSLALVPDATCYEPGDTVTVDVYMSDIGELIRGGQFFLSYNNSVLQFLSADPGDSPFIREVYEAHPGDGGAGTLDYAVGIPNGDPNQPPTAADTVMARITFQALAEVCQTSDLVAFRTHAPPTRLSGEFGGEVLPVEIDLPSITIDGTAPTISGLAAVGGNVDGDCEYTVTFSATVTDNCCVAASDVFVGVTLPAGNATLSDIVINKTQVSPTQVDVSGGALVSDLTSCPATVQVTVDADDCCDNAATQAVTIADVEDITPPTFTYCPPDVTVECIEDTAPGILYGVATGGIGVYYNDNGLGENPANQAYYKTQFGGAFPNTGAAFVYDDSPLAGASPFSWQTLYSGLPWPQSQFGLDLVYPAPTWDGVTPIPPLFAYDYDGVGPSNPQPVLWAIDDYKPHTPDITAGIVYNSIVRGPTPGNPLADIQFIRHYWTQSGTVFTAVFEGRLVSDGIHHWYNPAYTHDPMSNFALNGDFYFSGALTYDSAADPYPLMDFYAGTLDVIANFPSAATGIPRAIDNCTDFPVIAYTDVDNGGAGCPGDPLIITRTWTATDDCTNVESYVQTIMVIDTTAPVVSALAVTADEFVDGDCESAVSFSATVTDNCCLIAVDVVVGVSVTNATLTYDPNDLVVTQITPKWVTISGTAIVSGLTACPATVTVTVDADDCCDNAAIQGVVSADTTDNIDPVITFCPPDITVNADAGGCSTVLDPGMATATDNCDPAPAISWVRSDVKPNLTDPYDGADSPITITWRATDNCSNFVECVQTITVNAFNDLVVTVELSPNIDTGGVFPQTLTRCITFELWECDPLTGPIEVYKEVDFIVTSGAPNVAIGTATLTDAPCGPEYDCITARDELHTLRRTGTLTTTGSEPVQYSADFTGDPASGGDWLIGGNLNDDFWIDILDFGVFTSQWNFNYGNGDTTCLTAFPHADISGNGLVNTGDFTFIQGNFLESHEDNCCGALGLYGGGEGPITEISIEELDALGLSDLSIGDLNGDGWLDQADIVEFLNGVRPTPTKKEQRDFRRPIEPMQTRP